MKKFLLILSSVVVALTVRGNTIVFDTFGPGNTYHQTNGYVVGSGFSDAAQFTAGASGFLATVDIGLTVGFAPGPVNVFLYGDAAGSPDTANQTFLGTVTATAPYGSTNDSVVSLTLAGNVPVTLGSLYWLGLIPGDSNVDSIWHSSLATFGNKATSIDDGSTWEVVQATLPAFRLTVFDQNGGNGTGVPESGTTFVLMLGGIAALFALRRVLAPTQS